MDLLYIVMYLNRYFLDGDTWVHIHQVPIEVVFGTSNKYM